MSSEKPFLSSDHQGDNFAPDTFTESPSPQEPMALHSEFSIDFNLMSSTSSSSSPPPQILSAFVLQFLATNSLPSAFLTYCAHKQAQTVAQFNAEQMGSLTAKDLQYLVTSQSKLLNIASEKLHRLNQEHEALKVDVNQLKQSTQLLLEKNQSASKRQKLSSEGYEEELENSSPVPAAFGNGGKGMPMLKDWPLELIPESLRPSLLETHKAVENHPVYSPSSTSLSSPGALTSPHTSSVHPLNTPSTTL